MRHCQSSVPTCTIPCSRPVYGIGSCGYGGGYGGGSSVISYGGGGMATSASSLGMVPGVPQSCITQIPASEMVIQPSPVVVTIPGAILSSSCAPMAVGGYSPCASGYGYGSSYGSGSGYGYGCGYGMGGSIGKCYGSKRRQSICGYPC